MRRVLILTFLAGVLLTCSARAAEERTSEAESASPKVTLHGYLSQAYATTNRHQIFGIPKDGTADYRTAALQLRTEVSGRDALVLQVVHERLGNGPGHEAKDHFDLDWIFYERRVGDGMSARVGKVKIPFGIYNEIRFVGPLLPLFRAPEAFYGGGSYSFDSLNGVVASAHFFPGRRFSLDADLYAGEWTFVQRDQKTPAHAKNGLGGQIWLGTPIRGVRAGLAGHRSTVHNMLDKDPDLRERHSKWSASLDADLEHVRVNAEYSRSAFPEGHSSAAYALISWHATEKWSLTAQASRSHLVFRSPFPFDGPISRDYAIAARYAPRRSLQLKLENHWAEGHHFDAPGHSLLDPLLRSDYVILSVATFF
jgi:hypothetical protein